MNDLNQITGDYYTGFYEAPVAPEPNDDNESGVDGTDYYLIDPNSPTYNSDDIEYFQDVAEGRIDSEPDIFYYNFGSYAGSFVLGRRVEGSNTYVKEQDGLKFEISFLSPYNDYGSWKVTTPDGYTYFFSTVELTENCSTPDKRLTELDLEGLGAVIPNWGYTFKPSGEPIASSWYLDYIESLSGERISFTYDNTFGKTLSNVNLTYKSFDLQNHLWWHVVHGDAWRPY